MCFIYDITAIVLAITKNYLEMIVFKNPYIDLTINKI